MTSICFRSPLLFRCGGILHGENLEGFGSGGCYLSLCFSVLAFFVGVLGFGCAIFYCHFLLCVSVCGGIIVILEGCCVGYQVICRSLGVADGGRKILTPVRFCVMAENFWFEIVKFS